MKKEAKEIDPGTSPDGLTYYQFIEKYKDIPGIAKICWYFGIQPDDLKEELKKILND